jgi:hypothetical protein
MDNLISAGLYTLLIMVVAAYYWFEGHKKGVKETLLVFNEHEPEALKRVQQKVRKELNATDS